MKFCYEQYNINYFDFMAFKNIVKTAFDQIMLYISVDVDFKFTLFQHKKLS